MPRRFAKIKITGHEDQKEYKKLYAREYRKRFGKDQERIPGYKGHQGQTYSLYYKLKREGFPPGYQVLCRNCNWIKESERRENQNASADRQNKHPKQLDAST